MVDSWEGVVQGGVEAVEGEMEGSSWILWLDAAGDAKGEALKNLRPLLLAFGDPVHRGRQQDCRLE